MVQELLVLSDVKTTTICTHVLNRGGHGATSQLTATSLVRCYAAKSLDNRLARKISSGCQEETCVTKFATVIIRLSGHNEGAPENRRIIS